MSFSEPFKLNGEQLDGSLKLDEENYLVEAKWHDSLTASDALYHFAYKVEGKMYGRGLFIAINGYSRDAVKALIAGKSMSSISKNDMFPENTIERSPPSIRIVLCKNKSSTNKRFNIY